MGKLVRSPTPHQEAFNEALRVAREGRASWLDSSRILGAADQDALARSLRHAEKAKDHLQSYIGMIGALEAQRKAP